MTKSLEGHSLEQPDVKPEQPGSSFSFECGGKDYILSSKKTETGKEAFYSVRLFEKNTDSGDSKPPVILSNFEEIQSIASEKTPDSEGSLEPKSSLFRYVWMSQDELKKLLEFAHNFIESKKDDTSIEEIARELQEFVDNYPATHLDTLRNK